MERYGIEKGEIGLGYEAFAKQMAASFTRCEFVTFDYGDILPRNDFSARVYKDHAVFPLFEADLQSLYKKSDITYDVHFQHLIDAFVEAGFVNERYATQMVALTEFGIVELLEVLEKNVSYNDYLKEVGKVKTLLNPAFLGERFKMANFLQGWGD
jgi:SAM-dependent MidA family methyltransferase